jgi:hypothetical protein
MAGTDFAVEFTGAYERALLQRLLRHLQWRARQYGLELHYRKQREDDEYYVIVDGPLRSMQAFGPRVAMEVLVCAEFADRPKPAWRRTDLAHELIRGYEEGLEKITGAVLYLHRELKPLAIGAAGDLASPLSLVFDRTGVPTHLHASIDRFEATLAKYAAMPVMLLPDMIVEEEQMLEEAHTITELLLRTSVGVKSLSYRDLADRAWQQGWLTAGQHRLLLRLKDVRRGTKHKGQSVRLLAGYRMIMNAVACSHQLLAQIAGRPWW